MHRRTIFLGLPLSLLLGGCDRAADASKSAEHPAQTLSQIASGYIGDPDRMASFLRCWQRETGTSTGPAVSTTAPPIATDPVLPRSLRDFHAARARIGFRSLYESTTGDAHRFALSAPVAFSKISPGDFKIWKSAFATFDEPDSSYYRYDRSQQGFRGRDLDTMLVAGAERDGAFYLLIPGHVTKDGEMEAMLLHHGGLVSRYKSFAHLLVNLYLEERERHAGRDPSLGHLYYFPGNLAETCAAEIINLSL